MLILLGVSSGPRGGGIKRHWGCRRA